jgi:hypothetical protein
MDVPARVAWPLEWARRRCGRLLERGRAEATLEALMRYTGPDLHQGPQYHEAAARAAESSRGDAPEDDEAALGGAVSASNGAAGGSPSASPVVWPPSRRRAARRAAARLSAEVLRALCRHAPHTLCSSQPRCLRQLLGWMAAGSAGSAGRQPDGQGPQRRRDDARQRGGDSGGGGSECFPCVE